ncbi:N-acetylneuraminate synthase family protein [Hyphomicrobium sp.]|uniref:N-acetylneuraminate synthase family protein n=1 Tax=Hyphomicrobium sp. TaxID=82 RepID=UPI0025BADC38|nr:N-acetylneuraminate synthase family protein [Hyphomicrobium sp.]MCC7250942.1 N-acetylneuraminate synthase family protein [Hyphomicrobium sp.]
MNENLHSFDFENLFVLDVANNHQGSVAHGTAIIDACADMVEKHGVRAAMKFQFRDLPEFVHKDERAKPTNKHVPRFLSTKLDWSEFGELVAAVRRRGLLATCTPFDEASVDKIVELGFDIIKVASCSARDWPLLEKVAASGLPVIASTGGLTREEVDDLVSFLRHRGCDFALMHCVSIYPTPDEACHLANIADFRERYPGRVIGWSTHENPADTDPVLVATALGAGMFERHVGIATDDIKLNAYSSTPEQVDAWIGKWKKARVLLGTRERGEPLSVERTAIDDLKRGVFARVPIEPGVPITDEQVYFAFPYRAGQLVSGDWRSGIISEVAILPDAPLPRDALDVPLNSDEKVLKRAIHEVKALLAYARVPLSHEFTTEYSHHYGVANFRRVGAVLITVINREYAKKILVQLPGQTHPWHFHKLKEETFLLLWGDLTIELGERRKVLQPGDTLTVLPGVWHRFWTEKGCVFEEISTTAHPNDSVYRDPEINKLSSAQRKTAVDHWGRFQINEQLRSARVPAAE